MVFGTPHEYCCTTAFNDAIHSATERTAVDAVMEAHKTRHARDICVLTVSQCTKRPGRLKLDLVFTLIFGHSYAFSGTF